MSINKSSQLINYTIDCLYKCFLHDTEGFVNKEMFNVLLQPLVDQVRGKEMGGGRGDILLSYMIHTCGSNNYNKVIQ